MEGIEIIKLDGRNPASVQPVVIVAARLLASPILQEYEASIVELVMVADGIWKD